MHFSLTKLQCFIAVGEASSFRVASERLNISQPAVSNHVRELEDALGLPLLIRTTRMVRLTREGENFLVRARRVLSDLEDIVVDLHEQGQLRRGQVCFGCVPSIAHSIMPLALSAFMKRYPKIRVQIIDGYADELYQQTLNSEIDFMVGPESPNQLDLDFTHLFTDSYIAIVPVDHQLAKMQSTTLTKLVGFPFILLTQPANVRIVLQRAFDEAGHELRPAYEARNPYTVGGMIKAGLGITALPARILPSMTRSEIRGIPIRRPKIVRQIGVLKRRNEVLTPAADALAATFVKEINSSR